MKKRVTCLLLVALITLSPIISAQGQQAASPEETQIKNKREAIRELSAKSPQADAEEVYKRSLLRLRRELRDLLIERRGALKKDLRDLQVPPIASEMQDYINHLELLRQNVDAEVQVLDRDIEQSLAVAAIAPNPATPAVPNPAPLSVQAATPTPSPALKDEQKAFETVVSRFSDAQLKEAAAPVEVTATALPQPGCNERGRPNTTTFSKLDEFVCRLSGDISERHTKRILLSLDQAPLLSIMIAKLLKTTGDESYASFIAEAQEARTDQQLGAGPSSAGTTSLVVKGGVPYALGFAVENGAAVQSTSGTTVTFRLNPAGVLGLFTNRGFITGFRQDENDPVRRFLRKTSVSLTYDTSRGDQSGIFTGDKQQLSEISARYEFTNRRDPRLKEYEKEWEEFMANEGVRLAEQIWATTIALNNFGTRTDPISFKDPALQAWLEQTNTLIASAGTDINEIESIIRKQADLLPVKLVTDETVQAVTAFAKQFKAYTDAKNALLDKIARARVFTFEYTNKREVNAPDTSNFRFIAATGTGRRIDLTANGSLTLFNQRPSVSSLTGTRPGRIRDFQFAGQVDVPFGNVKETGQFVFWFSGRYERLLTDASMSSGEFVPNTRGNIAVGQFGLKIPIKGLGMQFPISLTFANRTELIKEKEIRGNFGFTFNLDQILSRLKPF